MYIVFFDYDGKRYFFGVTVGGAMTPCSQSYSEVASKLAHLQAEELKNEPELESPGALYHTKGFIQEKLIVGSSGATKTEPWVEGFISLLVNVEPRAYFAAPKDDPTFISVVDGPDGASILAQSLRGPK